MASEVIIIFQVQYTVGNLRRYLSLQSLITNKFLSDGNINFFAVIVFWKFEISWKNKNDFAGKTLTFLNQDICSFPSISYPFRAWRPLKGHPYLNKFPFFTGNQALNNYMSSMTIYAKETVYPRHHFFARFVVAV